VRARLGEDRYRIEARRKIALMTSPNECSRERFRIDNTREQFCGGRKKADNTHGGQRSDAA
jgi:hypothetical protein